MDLDLKDGNKTVELAFSGFKLDPDSDTFQIARVADARGIYTEGFGSSVLDFVAVEDRTIGFAADGIVATSTTSIEVEFDGNLSSYEVKDFFIEVDGEAGDYNIAALEIEDDNKIVLSIDEDTLLPANLLDGKKKLYLATRGGSGDRNYTIKTRNSSGAKLKAGQSELIIDKIKPDLRTEDDKKTSVPYVSPQSNGKEDNVPVVYATYYEDSDLTFVTAEFTEPLKEIDEDSIMVNDGDYELADNGVVQMERKEHWNSSSRVSWTGRRY